MGRIMVLGLSLAAFTTLHVLISLAAIASGIVVVAGMLRADRLGGWTALFLALTMLTSLTGFLFPIKGFTPALGTGLISVAILLVALWALYGGHLNGAWRPVYVVCAVAALYLNVPVLVVQAFLKAAPLHALAPYGSEPPFLVTETLALIVFVTLGFLALRRFYPPKPAPGL
jgi:hypothetical protein